MAKRQYPAPPDKTPKSASPTKGAKSKPTPGIKDAPKFSAGKKKGGGSC